MRRSTRTVAAAALAIGLGLTGCTGDAEREVNTTTGEEEVGSPDQVDGGDEDADGADRGTGGIDEDDNTGTEGED